MNMNVCYKHIIRVLLPCILPMFAVILASCSEDVIDDDRNGSSTTLQMKVGTRADGDVAGDAGEPNENIHSICVLLVNSSGNVAWKYIDDDFSADASATEYLSEPITDLPFGVYDVYAFANFDYYTADGELWNILTGIQEGASFDNTILSFVIDDPASMIDFDEGRFIPMSGKNENFNVTSATRIIPVTLDRLVSKVLISVGGSSAASVTQLVFGGWADKVTLFGDGALSGEAYNESKTFSASNLSGDGTTVTVEPFYVNETSDGHAFNVSLTTLETTAGKPETVYKATTSRDELPRNNIYPLNITINDWKLNITAQCWVSPIGLYPVPVKADFEENTYNIEIPEGAQFEFALDGLDGVTGSTATWNIDPLTTAGIAFENGYTNGETVKGHVTAAAGNSYTLGVAAEWTETNSYRREYTVTVTTTDLADAELMLQSLLPPLTRAVEWGEVRNVLPEVLDVHVER